MKFTGTLYCEDGSTKVVRDMELDFIEYQPEERAAGISNDYIVVCDPDAPEEDWEEYTYTVELYAWEMNECIQVRGGHEWVDGPSYEGPPEINMTWCAHCGMDRDQFDQS